MTRLAFALLLIFSKIAHAEWIERDTFELVTSCEESFHKSAHGLLGAGMGALLDPDHPKRGALSGAIGAVTAEVIADSLREDPSLTAARAVQKLESKGIPVTTETLSSQIQDDIRPIVNASRLGGAVVALLTGQNVDIAIATGTNAVENNFKMSVCKDAIAAYAEECVEALADLKATLVCYQ